jgi:hypothetical protein
MAEPTLTQVFGAGATQTATELVISKADLTGLTATANNSAESLFVAILLKAKEYLTTINYDANIDQSITVVTPDFNAQSLVTRNNTQYRQYSETVNLYKVDSSSAIDPDDF